MPDSIEMYSQNIGYLFLLIQILYLILIFMHNIYRFVFVGILFFILVINSLTFVLTFLIILINVNFSYAPQIELSLVFLAFLMLVEVNLILIWFSFMLFFVQVLTHCLLVLTYLGLVLLSVFDINFLNVFLFVELLDYLQCFLRFPLFDHFSWSIRSKEKNEYCLQHREQSCHW